jgi:hypothetical protein
MVPLHKRHWPQFGHPLLKSIRHQKPTFSMSHSKVLILGGTLTFQTILFILVDIFPKNHALYANTVEYWPLSESVQEMLTSMSSLRWMLYSWVHSSTNCTKWSKVKFVVTSIFATLPFSCKTFLAFYFFPLEFEKMRGAIYFVFDPFNQGATKKGGCPPPPLPTVIFVAA